MISDKKPVQDFVSLLKEHNIRHVIITPGSRNAPFSLSLIHDTDITSYSIVDERSAAFVALGMSQQAKAPVVLICTSGTATLNFAPAIAEAYYQRIPLIVVTADRPMEWIDQGEGQSIRQRNVYENYIKASFEIAEEASDGDLMWYNTRIMDEALRLCVEGVHGPVHINFPLRESLYKTQTEFDTRVKTVRRAETSLRLTESELTRLSKVIEHAGKVLVLAGQMPPDKSFQAVLARFAKRKNVVVLTEAHSNLADSNFVTTIDRLIMGFDAEQKAAIVPDLLITIGHNIISRKIKEYLRSGSTEHWHVDISGEGLDTLKHLTKIIPLSPSVFFEEIEKRDSVQETTDFRQMIMSLNAESKAYGDRYLTRAPWSDLKAFDVLMKKIPGGSHVQMGNSSVVRYILLSDTRDDLEYFGNRGVAGIDGCTSTAVGASFLSGKLTTLIIGDIGFFYDSNAFWNNLVSSNLKIVVINNGGGGIFRIIEGPQHNQEALEKYFETTHTRSASTLASMYDISFREAKEEADFVSGLEWLYQTEGCAILEVHTPRLENDKVLKDFFRYIKEQTTKSNS